MSRPNNLPPRSLFSQQQIEELAEVQAAILDRKGEALRIFEELPQQREFFRSPVSLRLARGGVRSAKTTSCAVETARCALNCDPFDKYPKARPKMIYIIGYDQDHIGRVIYPKLFKPGAFKIIKDKKTGQWRSWRPYLEGEAERYHETKPAPPLIPARYIQDKGWGWVNKAERVFSVCRLKNGTEIRAFSSKSEWAPQGDAVDLIWVDEDIMYARWIGELVSRLSDNRGKLIWSVFPHSSNDALVDLSRRAEEQSDRENPDIKEWVLTFSSNPYIPTDEKRKRKEDWAYIGEAELAARDRGEFSYHESLMYPMFHIDHHGLDPKDLPGGDVPQDWTRFLCVDPGSAPGTVEFCAIPPPGTKFGDIVLFYDEIYMKGAYGATIAKAIAEKSRGSTFRAFLIDDHGSRRTEEGSGRTIRWQFTEAFKKEGLWSEATGHDFAIGSDDILARNQSVREAMRTRDDGTPRLRVLKGRCPMLLREIERYRRKRNDRTNLVEEGPNDKGFHAVVVMQYLIAWPHLRYYKPTHKPRNRMTSFIERMKKRRSEDNVIPLY
jgi:hypothetical protein